MISLCALLFAWSPRTFADPVPVDRLARSVTEYQPVRSITYLGPVASQIYARTTDGFGAGLTTEFFSYAHAGDSSVEQPVSARTNVVNVRPTFGYRLHPRLVFNAQLSFDDGGAERSDTVTLRRGDSVVRFAYLDWLTGDERRAGVRVGHQLIPVGLTNTSADATTFFGVRRPELEREVVPNDWHENGALLWYEDRGIALEAGVFNSLWARGLRGETFLRGGRTGGQNAPANDLAAVARANVEDAGWLVGGSFVVGRSAQGNPAIPGGVVQLGEVHARLRRRRFELSVQTAQGRLTDAAIISALNDTVLGSKATGTSVQAAFEILAEDRRALWAFARHSVYDLHARVSVGYAADPRLDHRVTTVGLSYLPLPNVVVKLDAQRDVDAADLDRTTVEVGGGLLF